MAGYKEIIYSRSLGCDVILILIGGCLLLSCPLVFPLLIRPEAPAEPLEGLRNGDKVQKRKSQEPGMSTREKLRRGSES